MIPSLAEALDLVERIKDLCFDIDVWLDQRPGCSLEQVKERLGDRLTLAALRSEYARLLRQASLRGCPDIEEVAA
jgi:hypothetical protein